MSSRPPGQLLCCAASCCAVLLHCDLLSYMRLVLASDTGTSGQRKPCLLHSLQLNGGLTFTQSNSICSEAVNLVADRWFWARQCPLVCLCVQSSESGNGAGDPA